MKNGANRIFSTLFKLFITKCGSAVLKPLSHRFRKSKVNILKPNISTIERAYLILHQINNILF